MFVFVLMCVCVAYTNVCCFSLSYNHNNEINKKKHWKAKFLVVLKNIMNVCKEKLNGFFEYGA